MSYTPKEETREKLAAYVTMLRTTLPLNPLAKPSQLCRIVGVSAVVPSQLKELGAFSETPEGFKWDAQHPTEAIVDMLIEHRRRKETPAPVAVSAEFEARVWRSIEDVSNELAKLAKEVADLRGRPAAVPALTADERELMNMASRDAANAGARCGEVERQIGDLMRRVDAALRPPELALKAAASNPLRKWTVLVLGVWPRDVRHVDDRVNEALGAQAANVMRAFIAPDERRAPSVDGADFVVVTPDYRKPLTDLGRIACPVYRTTTGVRAVADMIVKTVKGL